MNNNNYATFVVVFFMALYMLPVSVEASDEQHPDSVVFTKQDTYDLYDLKFEAESKADQLHEYCQNLQKEIKDLEHKPLRHTAAYERYKAECLRY